MKVIVILCFVLSLCEEFENIFNSLKFPLRKLSEPNTIKSNETVKLDINQESNYLFIWPENCVLSSSYPQAENYTKFIQIPISSSSSPIEIPLNIENKFNSTDNCRFYYNSCSSSCNLELEENRNYGFKITNQQLSFTFKITNSTNPAYYFHFTNLGTGDLEITITEGNNSQNYKITDKIPFRALFINRFNLLKQCSNSDSYECTISINIEGNEIPFTLLIKNAHDSYPSYFFPNEMNLGIAEAFTPVFFYTEIPNGSEGEIFINYKRGGIIAIAKVDDKENNDTNGKIEQNNQLNDDLVYDYYNKKINNIKCSKQNGCFLYVGIYVYDIQVDDAADFSFFFRYTNDKYRDNVLIMLNEFVFGTLNNDNYYLTINNNASSLNLIFDSDYCELTTKLDNDEIKFTQYEKFYSYSGNSMQGKKLYLSISQKKNLSVSYPYYSLKVFIPDSNSLQLISSEHMEYCYLTSDQNCYFAYPIRDYENITYVTFYVFRESYQNAKFDIKTKEIDLNSISNYDVNFNNENQNSNVNLVTHEVTNKEKFIIVEISSKDLGLIYVLKNIYPTYQSRTLIPNTVNLFHFPDNHYNITYILPKGDNLQMFEFINIQNGGLFTFPTDIDNRNLSHNDYSYNIYPNQEVDDTNTVKKIIYYGQGDFILKTRISPNNDVISYNLNLETNNKIIMIKKYSNKILPILLYKKIPKDSKEISIPFNISFLNNNEFSEKFIYECGLSNELFIRKLESRIVISTSDENKIIDCTLDNYNGTLNISSEDNTTNFNYIYIYISTNGIQKTITTDSLEMNPIYEGNENNFRLYSNKINGFELPAPTGNNIFQINFFLPPYYNIFVHSYRNENDEYNLENKKNSTFTYFQTRIFRRRMVYLITKNSNDKGLRFYFYNTNPSRRFLQETENQEISLTSFKYQTSDDNSKLSLYNIISSDIIVKTNITTQKKNIIIYPIKYDNGTLCDAKYTLYLYNSNISDDEIDSLDNKIEPFQKISEYYEENDNSLLFELDITDNNTYKLTAEGVINNDEIVNYKIITIKMNSTQTDTQEDSSFYSGTSNNYFSKETDKKKSKWWIALIVIGVVIVIIVIILCYIKRSHKNSDYNTITGDEKNKISNDAEQNQTKNEVQLQLHKK